MDEAQPWKETPESTKEDHYYLCHRHERTIAFVLWILLGGLRICLWVDDEKFNHNDAFSHFERATSVQKVEALTFASCTPEMSLYMNDCNPLKFPPCGDRNISLARPLQAVLSPVLPSSSSSSSISQEIKPKPVCNLRQALKLVAASLDNENPSDDQVVEEFLSLVLFHSWYQLDHFFGQQSQNQVYNYKGPESALQAQTTMATVIVRLVTYLLLQLEDEQEDCSAKSLGLTKACPQPIRLESAFQNLQLKLEKKKSSTEKCVYLPIQSPSDFCLDRRQANLYSSFLKEIIGPILQGETEMNTKGPISPSFQCPIHWAQGYTPWQYFGPTLIRMEPDLLTLSCKESIRQLPRRLQRLQEQENAKLGYYLLFLLWVAFGSEIMTIHSLRDGTKRKLEIRKRQRQQELEDPVLSQALVRREMEREDQESDDSESLLLKLKQEIEDLNPEEVAKRKVEKLAREIRKQAFRYVVILTPIAVVFQLDVFHYHLMIGWSKIVEALLIPVTAFLLTYRYDPRSASLGAA